MHAGKHQLGQLSIARRQGFSPDEAVLQGCRGIHSVICAAIGQQLGTHELPKYANVLCVSCGAP